MEQEKCIMLMDTEKDKLASDIISALDAYARCLDPYEYGLPINGVPLQNQITIIKKIFDKYN